MSLAQGNNTPTRPRIEPGSPDPESDALTTRPVRPLLFFLFVVAICDLVHDVETIFQLSYIKLTLKEGHT